MIRQVCFYCSKYLGSIEEPGKPEESLSHGVCSDCLPRFVAGTGKSFAEFLDSLPVPVFVLDEEGYIAAANAKARRLVSKDLGEIERHLAGEVFGCQYSKLPGGCGQTVHCKTCTIRRTVTATFETGEPCIRVPAYVDLGDITEAKTIRFLISTEKAGRIVLLRIDDVQTEDPGNSRDSM
ncbi:MAG: hypothetical protein EHM36_15580 [Deltaproteobacteria bacterium]|nr:MAG: hypothetical protein EHM36_15580 [Deltaproteobacteria bacterium]